MTSSKSANPSNASSEVTSEADKDKDATAGANQAASKTSQKSTPAKKAIASQKADDGEPDLDADAVAKHLDVKVLVVKSVDKKRGPITDEVPVKAEHILSWVVRDKALTAITIDGQKHQAELK
jgi:hypothetical protein